MTAAQATTPVTRLGGKFLLRRKIARGGMGDIWIALNEATKADVAIKVLRPEFASVGDLSARFRHEAQVSSLLAHRNIVRVFDLLEEQDGTLALVMELLRGEALSTYMKRKAPFSAGEAIAIVLPILSALAHAHSQGVVHRDLKPGNIVLAVEPDGVVAPKLLDFGIAKTSGGSQTHTKMGQVLGTPRYMAPEQIRAQKLDGRADLFSLTVVLVEMLTGKSPFDAPSASASLASVLEVDVDPDPSIDPRLWMVIKRGLAKQAYERFADASEYADALRRCMPELEPELAGHLRRPPPESGAYHVTFADTKALDEAPEIEAPADSLPPAPIELPANLLRSGVARRESIPDSFAPPADLSSSVAVEPDPGLKRRRQLVVGLVAGLALFAVGAGGYAMARNGKTGEAATTTATTPAVSATTAATATANPTAEVATAGSDGRDAPIAAPKDSATKSAKTMTPVTKATSHPTATKPASSTKKGVATKPDF